MTLISFIKTQLLKIRKAPYASDQKGIMRRYFREKSNWDIHLENTKAFIIQSVRNFKKGKVAVLGSGWLLDVPMAELLQKFDEVWLFDICHPLPVQHRYANHEKVKFVELDLNNELFRKVIPIPCKEQIIEFITNNKPLQFEIQFDFMISVNLLNQLDILLVDELMSRFNWTSEELIHIRQIIQQNHLSILKQQPACLISDYEELRWVDEKVEETQNLVFVDWPTSSNTNEWIWIFDTHKYYHKNFNVSFKVKALTF